MLQILTGQVYSLESDVYTKDKGTPQAEQKEWVRFRLGMAKPYAETISDGNGGTTEQRQKTFATIKCFNGLAPTLIKFFGGDENKGKWIQLFGHWEENDWETTVEVDNPANANEVLELQIPVKRLEFMVSSFNFIGNPPAQPAAQPKSNGGVTVKTKVKGAANTGNSGAAKSNSAASAAEKAMLDDEAPF